MGEIDLKKVISLILSILLVISCTCSVTLFANAMENSSSFSVGTAQNRAGGTVEIPIEIQHNPGITSFRIIVEYDSAILNLTNVVFKEAAQGFNTGTSQGYDSPYSISGFNAGTDINNNGQLAVLTFEINQYAEDGRYDISLTYDEDDIFNMAGDNVPFAVNNGFVEVIPCQHTGGKWEYLEKETCTEDGIMIKKCEICGNEYESKKVNAKGHTFCEWVIEKAATCTENGEKSRICSVCTYEESEIINALDHNYSEEFVIDKAATCTENGEKSKHCSRCDDRKDITLIPAVGHPFGEWETVVSPDCTNSGSRQRVCKNCGFTEMENLNPNGHKWNSDYTIDIPATCTTNGSKSIHCKNCDAVKDSQVIPAQGHNFGEYKVIKQATCVDSGREKRVCAACAYFETREISALGHDYSDEFTVDKSPICTENGEKTRHCSRCDARIDVTVIQSEGHNYGDWIVEKAPTRTEEGKQFKTCENCGDKIYESIVKLPYIADKNDNKIILETDKVTQGDSVQFIAVAAGLDNVNPIENDVRYIPAVYIVDGVSIDFTDTQYSELIKTEDMSVGEHTVEVIFAEQKFDGVQWINTDETVSLTNTFIVDEKISEPITVPTTNPEKPAKPNDITKPSDTTAKPESTTNNSTNKNTSKTSPNTGNTTALPAAIFATAAFALGLVCVTRKKKDA